MRLDKKSMRSNDRVPKWQRRQLRLEFHCDPRVERRFTLFLRNAFVETRSDAAFC